MEWYASLTPQAQAALQGVIVMGLVAIIRAACHWAGHPISETKAAKLGNYIAVAVATAATTLVTTGATEAFWLSWMAALWAAVGAWEGLSKFWAALADEDTDGLDTDTKESS